MAEIRIFKVLTPPDTYSEQGIYFVKESVEGFSLYLVSDKGGSTVVTRLQAGSSPSFKRTVTLYDIDWFQVDAETWAYIVLDSDIVSADDVLVVPIDRPSEDFLGEAGADSFILVESGQFKITARSHPSADINIEYIVRS